MNEVDDLDSSFPKQAAPTKRAAAPPATDEVNDLDSSFPKATQTATAGQNTNEKPSGPGWGTTLAYGLADAVPFSRDLGALAQTGETYLPKWAQTDDVGATDPNASFGSRFSQQKERINNVGESVSRSHPYVSTALPIVAGAAALPVSGPTSLASRGIGYVLPSLGALPRAGLAAGAVGAGYGGLYGAGQGDTLAERAQGAKTGAEFGAVAGAATPFVTAGLGGVFKGIGQHLGLGSPEAEAASRVRSAVEPNAIMDPNDVQSAVNAGQPITVGDVLGGKKVGRLAEGAMTASPEAESTFRNVLDPRFEDNGERAKAFMQNITGSNLDPSDIIDNLRGQAQVANKANYDAAFNDPAAKSVWNPELENLIQAPPVKAAIADANRVSQMEEVIQRAQARKAGAAPPSNPIVRNPFITDSNGNLTLPTDPQTGKPTVTPSLPFWDIVKRNLDAQVQKASDTFGKPTNESRLIGGVRDALKDNLDSAVPSYAQARSGAAGFFGEQDAFSAGLNYLSKKNALKSTQADAAFDALTGPQKQLFAQGVASDFANKAANANTRQNALRQFNDPTTRAKLQKVMGPLSDKVESYLRIEGRFDQIRQAIGNSRTAPRMADQRPLGHGVIGAIANQFGAPGGFALVGGAEAARENGFDPMSIAKGAGAGAAAGLVLNRGLAQNQKVNEAIARLLMENDPHKVMDAVNTIATKPGMLARFRGLDSQLAIPASQRLAQPSQNKQAAPAYAKGGAVKNNLSHEQLVSRLMSAAEKAKAETKKDTKATLALPDNVVAKALSVAQKAV